MYIVVPALLLATLAARGLLGPRNPVPAMGIVLICVSGMWLSDRLVVRLGYATVLLASALAFVVVPHLSRGEDEAQDP